MHVKDLGKHDVAVISFGAHHSAILTDSGQVQSMGSNAKGQFGCGHTKQRDVITMVKGLEDELVSVSCLICMFGNSMCTRTNMRTNTRI